MLEVALLLQEAIKEYFKSQGKIECNDDRLTDDEQVQLRYIKGFLELLKQLTKAIESLTTSLNRVLPSIDFILAYFKKAKETFKDDKKLRQIINSGQAKIEKYYSKTDKSPAYTATVVLNPSRKWQYIDRFQRESQKQPAKDTVKKLQEEQYKPITSITTIPASNRPSINEFKLWLYAVDTPNTTYNEYEQYCRADRAYGFKTAINQ